MKTLFIKDILERKKIGVRVELLGWVKSNRRLKGVVFLDIVDSSGTIQAVAYEKKLPKKLFLKVCKIPVEASVSVSGIVRSSSEKAVEIEMHGIEIIGDAKLNLSPHPRKPFDIFNTNI